MVHYGEPETTGSDPRRPITGQGSTPQDAAAWIGGPVTGEVAWIGMPAANTWIGGGMAQDGWIGVATEQTRARETSAVRERQQLASRDLVRTQGHGRGRAGRPVDRAKLPPFLQSHPRFRGAYPD